VTRKTKINILRKNELSRAIGNVWKTTMVFKYSHGLKLAEGLKGSKCPDHAIDIEKQYSLKKY